MLGPNVVTNWAVLGRSVAYPPCSSSSSSVFPAISLVFTCLFHLLFFFCVPSYISGVHFFLLLLSQPYLLCLNFFFFCFCVSSYISGVHHFRRDFCVFFFFYHFKSNHRGTHSVFVDGAC